MMPGAYSTNELSSQYNVRGGNYDENLVYVNNIEIYRPFLVRNAQQEGLSFINPDLVRSIKFSAGAFEAKYGNKMSSVMDVEYKRPTKYATSFSVSLLGLTAHTEGNVNDVFTYLVGVRYKANAYLFNTMESKGDYKPLFFDTQLFLTWKPKPKFEITLLGKFSRNRFLFIPEDRVTSFGTFSQPMQLKIYFEGQEVDLYENYLGAITFNYLPKSNHTISLILSSYYAKESETYDILSQYWLSDTQADMSGESEDMLKEVSQRGVGSFLEHARNSMVAVVSAADVRGEHKWGNHTFSWSTKLQHEYIDDHLKEWVLYDSADYTLPCLPTNPGDTVSFDDPSRLLNLYENDYISATHQLQTLRLTGFIQDSWKISRDSAYPITLIAGLRYHYWNYNNEFVISPRINLIYKPLKNRNWVFYFKTGLYYQPPFYREMRDTKGALNDQIQSQRSFQAVVAGEYTFRMWERPFRFSTEVYYKYLDRLISYHIDNMKLLYTGKNDAKGYATGIDFRLSGEFVKGLESWISLSLMNTKEDILDDAYTNENGTIIEPGYIPRPTDQLFAVNIFFQDHFPKIEQFRVHLNFVFASGTPYCDPKMPKYTVFVLNTHGKEVVRRTTWYRRVDVGFSYLILDPNRNKDKQKSKILKSINSLSVYLEVFNLLGTNNISSYMWIKDIYNQGISIPNYLTQRLINLKLSIDF
jgi:hypothetical protein